MEPIPLTRRHHLQHFTTTLETNGFSSERFFGRMNMPMWQYGDSNDLIPLRHVLSILHETARMVGDEKFGLLVGEKAHFDDSTTFGALVSRSLTTYDAMKTTCRLAKAHTSLANIWLEEAGDTIWFCRSNFAGMNVGLQQHEQYAMTVLIGIVRQYAGPEWKPAEMWLCAPNEPRLEETEILSDVRIRYGRPHGGIAVPRSIAGLPIRRNVTSSPLIKESLEQRFRSKAPADDFVGSLRQVIQTLLKEGQPSMETASEVVGTSVRSLQRRLHCEKVTYRQLLGEVLFGAAVELMTEPGATVTEVAFELGYSDVAHFTRAFRHWAGVSPREYRRLNMDS